MDNDTHDVVFSMRALACSLPHGWSARPPVPTASAITKTPRVCISKELNEAIERGEAEHPVDEAIVASELQRMQEAEARRRWHRRKNGERAVRLRKRWAEIRSKFDEELAERVDAALERAIGICGRVAPETLGAAQTLADDLRELAAIIPPKAPPVVDNAQDQPADVDPKRERTADTKTAKPKKYLQGLPEDPEVTKLASLIIEKRKQATAEGSPKPTKLAVAREFTGGDEGRAQAYLRTLRRYPHLID